MIGEGPLIVFIVACGAVVGALHGKPGALLVAWIAGRHRDCAKVHPSRSHAEWVERVHAPAAARFLAAYTRGEALRRRPGDQPLPVVHDDGRPDIQSLVVADLTARRQLGIDRYGTALQAGNGRDALWDLYEELLDAACYTRQLIEERRPLKEDT